MFPVASGCFHLQKREHLFDRMIAMGGSSFNRPRPYQRLQKTFDSLMAEWDFGDKTPREKVNRLLAAMEEGSVGSLGRKFGVGPVVDGDLVHDKTSFSTLATPSAVESLFPGVDHCKTIMIGACEADVSDHLSVCTCYPASRTSLC